MKVNELVGYKGKPEYNLFKSPPAPVAAIGRDSGLQGIVNKLDELGYRKYSIGSGYYAQVYARPEDNYVIKIFREDPGYARFLQFIKTQANNPYVPKLKGKIINLPNKYSLVRLEKLSRIDIDLFKKIEFAAFNPYDTELVSEINEKYPGLLKFIESLLDQTRGGRIAFDLHRGNMMMRGDTPVIIDPFAES